MGEYNEFKMSYEEKMMLKGEIKSTECLIKKATHNLEVLKKKLELADLTEEAHPC